MSFTSVSSEENRRTQRIPMSLPIKVDVKIDQKVKWDEITRLKDVSTFGAGFILARPVKRGRLVYLTIPMPRKLRSFDFADSQYKVWGIIRRCIKINSTSDGIEQYAVGVAFIGKNPPDSFIQNPSTIYEIVDRNEDGFWDLEVADTQSDESNLPKPERRHSRYLIPINVLIEILDENNNIVASEQSATENLSLSGAAVMSSLNPAKGSFVRFVCAQYEVVIISIIRGNRLGPDGIRRLHLEFVDRFFPLEGIQ